MNGRRRRKAMLSCRSASLVRRFKKLGCTGRWVEEKSWWGVVYNIKSRAPAFDQRSLALHVAASSNQATLRHTRGSAYRCFLPDLTGFTESRCAGPDLHHRLQRPDRTTCWPGAGIRPCF